MASWRRSVVEVRAAAVVLAVCAAAAGQDAKSLFQEGTRLFNQRQFRASAESFEAAFRASPHPFARYNAAVAWQSAAEPLRAAEALEQALQLEGLDERSRRDARERLERLDQQLGRVEVVGPPGGRVRGGPFADEALPARGRVRPGAYVLRVRFGSGAEALQEVEVAAGSSHRLTFAEPPPAAPAGPAASSPPAPAPPVPAPPVPAGPARWPGYALLGGAAVGVGVGVGLGLSALSARDRFEASGRRDQDLHDQAAAQRLGANIGWAVAAVAGAAGLYLVLRPAPDARVSVVVSPGRLGLSLPLGAL